MIMQADSESENRIIRKQVFTRLLNRIKAEESLKADNNQHPYNRYRPKHISSTDIDNVCLTFAAEYRRHPEVSLADMPDFLKYLNKKFFKLPPKMALVKKEVLEKLCVSLGIPNVNIEQETLVGR